MNTCGTLSDALVATQPHGTQNVPNHFFRFSPLLEAEEGITQIQEALLIRRGHCQDFPKAFNRDSSVPADSVPDPVWVLGTSLPTQRRKVHSAYSCPTAFNSSVVPRFCSSRAESSTLL